MAKDGIPKGLSADGRFLAYEARPYPGDLFVYDRVTATTTKLNVGTPEMTLARSNNPAISGDGHYAIFVSFYGSQYLYAVFLRDLVCRHDGAGQRRTSRGTAPSDRACNLMRRKRHRLRVGLRRSRQGTTQQARARGGLRTRGSTVTGWLGRAFSKTVGLDRVTPLGGRGDPSQTPPATSS